MGRDSREQDHGDDDKLEPMIRSDRLAEHVTRHVLLPVRTPLAEGPGAVTSLSRDREPDALTTHHLLGTRTCVFLFRTPKSRRTLGDAIPLRFVKESNFRPVFGFESRSRLAPSLH